MCVTCNFPYGSTSKLPWGRGNFKFPLPHSPSLHTTRGSRFFRVTHSSLRKTFGPT
jgi:hypothetical protein